MVPRGLGSCGVLTCAVYRERMVVLPQHGGLLGQLLGKHLKELAFPLVLMTKSNLVGAFC